jgi:hypothetical protein
MTVTRVLPKTERYTQVKLYSRPGNDLTLIAFRSSSTH